MPHMDDKLDIVMNFIDALCDVSQTHKKQLKDQILDLCTEEWNHGYDFRLNCELQEHRNMDTSTREDLQDQIDDLQQQVGDLQLTIADLMNKSGDILDAIGWERYKKKCVDPGPHRMSVSRFFVEWDVESDEPGIGPKSHRLHQIVYARDAWFAENKIRVAQPHGKNFQTFPLFKEGA